MHHVARVALRLHDVALHCTLLHCVAPCCTCCRRMQCVALLRTMLHCIATCCTCCTMLHCLALRRTMLYVLHDVALPCLALSCNLPHCVSPNFAVLQHAALHCNMLHCVATCRTALVAPAGARHVREGAARRPQVGARPALLRRPRAHVRAFVYICAKINRRPHIAPGLAVDSVALRHIGTGTCPK